VNPATFAASATSMFTPEQVADTVVEAMRTGQLYLTPDPGSLARIDKRLNRIREEAVTIQMEPGAPVNSLAVFNN